MIAVCWQRGTDVNLCDRSAYWQKENDVFEWLGSSDFFDIAYWQI